MPVCEQPEVGFLPGTLSPRHEAQEAQPSQKHGIRFRFRDNVNSDDLAYVVDVHRVS